MDHFQHHPATICIYIASTSWNSKMVSTCKHHSYFFSHGLSTPRTITATIMRRIMMAMHVHLRVFFCSFFAFCKAVVPDCTWSTALDTCVEMTYNIDYWANVYTEKKKHNELIIHEIQYCPTNRLVSPPIPTYPEKPASQINKWDGNILLQNYLFLISRTTLLCNQSILGYLAL